MTPLSSFEYWNYLSHHSLSAEEIRSIIEIISPIKILHITWVASEQNSAWQTIYWNIINFFCFQLGIVGPEPTKDPVFVDDNDIRNTVKTDNDRGTKQGPVL